MATKPECLDLLQAMFTKWPHTKAPDKAAYIKAYVADIIDVPNWCLVRALDKLRKTSTFIPSVPELRYQAGVEAGLWTYASKLPRDGGDFSDVNPHPPKFVIRSNVDRLVGLEHAFYHLGEYDPGAWEILATDCGPFMAARVREKAERMAAEV